MAAARFTFDVTPELRAMMDAHPEVNWSAVLREAIRRKAEAAELERRIAEELDDPAVQELAAKIKKGAAAKFRKASDTRRR